ncbi:MAG TPA: TIGR03790 family protein [Steroidobacteraceae bacterium]|nr:TIGR03790 family protein [Steroidobacteraceae bacterium]
MKRAAPWRSHATRRIACITFGVLLAAGLALHATSAPADEAWGAGPRPVLPGINARELALIINDADPLSVRVGEYYRLRRHIPRANILHVRLAAAPVLSAAEFARVKEVVEARTPARVQAYALAWTEPYRVACMSVTSAFAYGFDPRFCTVGCRRTPMSPYFDSDTRRPFGDLHMRPTMMLAARDWAHAKALIDRGVAADESFPLGTAYLLDTDDKQRDVRAATFTTADRWANARVRVRILSSDALRDRSDVLFYFTGLTRVAGLDTLHFLPGAIADHLTSFGGELIGSTQMSSLAWLEAGATASYGTVVEPCNFPQKFPSVPIVMRRYLAGETLIEAYWKSVAEPSQGVFIGEPLARPFARSAEARRFAAASAQGPP